jgi:hypothetical protein
VRLNRDETATAYHCVAAVIRGFNTSPPPWAVSQLYDRLNTELRSRSQSGRECCCAGEQSTPDKLLSAREVASMLAWSKRHVNRNAELLGGVKVDGVNVFYESAIIEHLEGRDA